jgi:KDO2-lipid IV(A) lauroyltransferase
VIAVLPLRAALWFGRRFGELAYFVVYPRTKVALEQIAWAIPELSRSERRRTIRAMYRQFGQGMMEFFRLPRMVERGEFDRIVTVEGEHIIRDAFAQGKGLLILTAHYGNFELLATLFAARGYQVNLVTRKLRNGVLDRYWAAQRRRLKIRAIFKTQSLKEVIGRLRRNEAMGYVLDQNMGPGQGVFVDFFGRPACTVGVVAVLAKRFGSPVVPVFIARDPEDPTRHRIVFEPPVAYESRAGDKSDADIVENTQRYTAIIERRVRERPDHWIWIHKRWKTRPDQKTGPEADA